jgi:hypothetical protein
MDVTYFDMSAFRREHKKKLIINISSAADGFSEIPSAPSVSSGYGEEKTKTCQTSDKPRTK